MFSVIFKEPAAAIAFYDALVRSTAPLEPCHTFWLRPPPPPVAVHNVLLCEFAAPTTLCGCAWSGTPIRDTSCCCHPLTTVPYLRPGPRTARRCRRARVSGPTSRWPARTPCSRTTTSATGPKSMASLRSSSESGSAMHAAAAPHRACPPQPPPATHPPMHTHARMAAARHSLTAGGGGIGWTGADGAVA